MDTYNSYFDIRDAAKNKKELEKVELSISENEKAFREENKKAKK